MLVKRYTILGFIVFLSLFEIALSQQAETITEISLEIQPGSFFQQRELKITFRKDGTAYFNGKEKAPRRGKYKGLITTAEFDNLAKLIADRKFNNLKSSLPVSSEFTRGPNSVGISPGSIVTTVVINGKRRSVQRLTNVKLDSLSVPSKDLLVIENAILTSSEKITWTKETK